MYHTLRSSLMTEKTQLLRFFSWKAINNLYNCFCCHQINFLFDDKKTRMKYKKDKGNQWENLVAAYYQNQWYLLIVKNYTIVWWELDLIFQKNNILTFVEVKVVDHVEDLQNYVTSKKLWHIKRTIKYYLLSHGVEGEYTLDIVFVRNNSILQVIQNVTNT